MFNNSDSSWFSSHKSEDNNSYPDIKCGLGSLVFYKTREQRRRGNKLSRQKDEIIIVEMVNKQRDMKHCMAWQSRRNKIKKRKLARAESYLSCSWFFYHFSILPGHTIDLFMLQNGTLKCYKENKREKLPRGDDWRYCLMLVFFRLSLKWVFKSGWQCN